MDASPASFGTGLARSLRDELRPLAESRMRATCTITRPGPPVTDANGVVTASTTSVYVGKCYTRTTGAGRDLDSVGTPVSVIEPVVRVPAGTSCKVGDVVTINADPDSPVNVGRKLRITIIQAQSQATAERLICEDFQEGVA